MNTYLIKVEIQDNSHMYREFGLIEGENYGDAELKAKEQVLVDSLSDESLKDPKDRWWLSNDQKQNNVTITLKSIEPIDEEDAQALEMHGIAYFINR